MINKKIKLVGLIIICLCFITACGFKEHNSTINNNSTNKESRWTMNFSDVEFTLPCTMADLEKKGIHLYTEYDEEMIYESRNESFVWISAVYGNTDDILLLSIDTGDNPDKKAENANVIAVTNMELDKELFHMKGNFSLGASINDMEKTFGTDYEVPGATTDNIREGFTICQYKSEYDNILFNFRDDKLVSMEVQYIENND